MIAGVGSGTGSFTVSPGFYNSGLALSPDVERNVGSGPVDVSNSYRFTNGATAVVPIHYVEIQNWNHSTFFFFREPATVVTDGDWFIRLENDAGDVEYAQLERSGTTLTLRVHFTSGPDHVESTAASPLFDGSWHRVAWTTGSPQSRFRLDIDGVNYFTGPAGAPVALTTPMTTYSFGNIDVELALLGFADYYEGDLYVGFPGLATEAAIRNFVQTNTDTPPSGLRYWGGYYQMQTTETGET